MYIHRILILLCLSIPILNFSCDGDKTVDIPEAKAAVPGSTTVEFGGVNYGLLGGSQRAIIGKSVEGVSGNRETVFCAEPPPDAASALAEKIASSLGGGVSLDVGAVSGSAEGQASSSSELSQSIENLFDRSQGIQALRDGMYRLCEARSNGFINNDVFEINLTHLVGTLNFVVPIELCTEMVVNLGTSVSIDKCVDRATEFASVVLRSWQSAKELAFASKKQDFEILQFQEYRRLQADAE